MMNLPQGAPVDPVSQNQVPPGAMPKEVRDDVPIRASEGEYIIPADVVRFLGLEKIESLVAKAKESLSQLHEGGRIGGKPMPEKTSAPPSPAQPMAAPSRPVGMAEGGVVAPGGTSASMAAYVGPDGKLVYIPLVNGQPLTPVPAGYKPASSTQQTVQPNRSSNQGGTSFLTTPMGARQQPQANTVENWTVDDFINYGQRLESGVPDALTGVINSILPFSNILTGLAERNMQATVPGLIDQMIETGVDAQGNQLTPEQREGLLNTRNVMADRIANETGSRFNPFESLTNFVGRIIGGGNSNQNTQSSSNSLSNPSSSGQSRSPVAPPSGASSSPTSMSTSGSVTSTPDKEENSMGAKTFAYGGLVSGKGFMPRQSKQPIIGGARPVARFEEGGLVRLPAIGAKPSGRADEPRGFLSRELGQAANEPGRFQADVAVQHSYMSELEDVVSHIEEFTAGMKNLQDLPPQERVRSFLQLLTEGEWKDYNGETLLGGPWNSEHDTEDLNALRSRTGV